jgi:hypothetical protein
MGELRDVLLILAIFALRVLIPLGITLALGYLLNRLCERWQAATETRGAPLSEEAAQGTQPALRIALPPDVPCWTVQKCDPANRANCPAYLQPEIPCWLARLRAEGALPSPCPTCPLFTRVFAQEGVTGRSPPLSLLSHRQLQPDE